MAARDVRNEAGMSLGDIYGVLRRRRAWFLVPTALGVVASLVLALTLPAEYEAAATVTVEPPVIPDKLAPNTIASDTETRYENLKLQLLARDSLSSIITDFNLFEGDTSAREVQVEQLRERISIAPLPPAIVDPRKPVELNSFRVSFRWSNPKISAEVSNRLARDFISANLRDRTSLADGTMEFFDQQLQKARSSLADVARQITDYKENFQGELPEQLLLNRDRLERNRIDLSKHRVEARDRARPAAAADSVDQRDAHRERRGRERPEPAQAPARARAQPGAVHGQDREAPRRHPHARRDGAARRHPGREARTIRSPRRAKSCRCATSCATTRSRRRCSRARWSG